jgi:hypothetical protein
MSLHTAWTRAGIVSPAAVALLLLLPRLALASDPTPPVNLIDDGAGFRIQLGLSVPASGLQVSAIYNRIGGTLVDAGAQTVNNVPVRRLLQLQQDTQGQYFVDASPFAPGLPTPPTGVYSLWIEVHHTPAADARGRLPFTLRRTIFFRVVNGAAQRLTLAQYSTTLDPAGTRKNKLGLQEPVHGGFTTPRVASSQSAAMQLVESGDAYSTPDNSEAGQ